MVTPKSLNLKLTNPNEEVWDDFYEYTVWHTKHDGNMSSFADFTEDHDEYGAAASIQVNNEYLVFLHTKDVTNPSISDTDSIHVVRRELNN